MTTLPGTGTTCALMAPTIQGLCSFVTRGLSVKLHHFSDELFAKIHFSRPQSSSGVWSAPEIVILDIFLSSLEAIIVMHCIVGELFMSDGRGLSYQVLGAP